MFKPIVGVTNDQMNALQNKILEIILPEKAQIFIDGYRDGGGEVTVKAQGFIQALIEKKYQGGIQCAPLDNGINITQSFKTQCTFKEGLLQPTKDGKRYFIKQGKSSTCKIVEVNQIKYIVIRLSAMSDKDEATGEYFIQPLIQDLENITPEEKIAIAKEMEYYYYDIIQKADQSTEKDDSTIQELASNNQYPSQISATYDKKKKDEYYIPRLETAITTKHNEAKIWQLFESKTISNQPIESASVIFNALGYYDQNGVIVENEQSAIFILRGGKPMAPNISEVRINPKIPYFFVHKNAKKLDNNNEQVSHTDLYPFCILDPKNGNQSTQQQVD